MKVRIKSVFILPGDSERHLVAVFGYDGEQIAELQGWWKELASAIYARADADTTWSDSRAR